MRWALVCFAALVGTASLMFGLWLIYQPAMFVIGGLLLLSGALIYDVKPRSERDKTARRPPRN